MAVFPLGSPKVCLQGFVVHFCLIELTVCGAPILSPKHADISIFESFVTLSLYSGFFDKRQSTLCCLSLLPHLISRHSSNSLS